VAVALSATIILCVMITISVKRSQLRPVPSVTPEGVTTVSASLDVTFPELNEPDVVEMIEETAPNKKKRSEIAKDAGGVLVVVDKSAYTLEVFRDGNPVKEYGIAVGKNIGDKKRVGDMRTPEGEFPIVQIQDSSGWTHDFRDGKGNMQGAYGPYFIRLGTPGWSGIGIHGTHAPSSIGTNITEGCIRLNNDDIAELRRILKVGDKVVIRN
jgi:lipoprotein-anchoring transpeptidase ErfK/SrfK